MNITEHNIIVNKTARYCSNDPGESKITNTWIVIHGYAQLAKDFIREFEFLSVPEALIVAPEGLSKFYSKNNPAASWMTKEDRSNEINDYINYLEKIFTEINNSCDLTSSKINLLGFSQGVHTAVRWFIKSRYHFDKLILCSSDFPGDADFAGLKEKLSRSELFYLQGRNDRITTPERFAENLELLRNNNIKAEEIYFDGQHEIDPDAILKVHLTNK
ncbi:MAG TPA: hypothetical protein PKA90_07175 [Ignavibacteria bacterium]|nr:hypothetical protein [Ignavibacteria bacterium]HMR40197.1 hypothetical protein [Ignavibacteria bacterium]